MDLRATIQLPCGSDSTSAPCIIKMLNRGLLQQVCTGPNGAISSLCVGKVRKSNANVQVFDRLTRTHSSKPLI
jgi:hypothetical protein